VIRSLSLVVCVLYWGSLPPFFSSINTKMCNSPAYSRKPFYEGSSFQERDRQTPGTIAPGPSTPSVLQHVLRCPVPLLPLSPPLFGIAALAILDMRLYPNSLVLLPSVVIKLLVIPSIMLVKLGVTLAYLLQTLLRELLRILI
jgi:hypothetical protein